MVKPRFRSTMTPPPGGIFFYEHEGERIEARTWLEMEPKMRELMRRHGLSGVPAHLVAEFMCPHMPDWYCTGDVSRHVVRASEAKTNASKYFGKQTVTFDVLSARLRRCHDCPAHSRPFCLTCTGLLDWIMASFGNRRVKVPEDKVSGVCSCAKTMEAVIASVDHGDDEVWEGVPDTCWRKTE